MCRGHQAGQYRDRYAGKILECRQYHAVNTMQIWYQEVGGTSKITDTELLFGVLTALKKGENCEYEN